MYIHKIKVNLIPGYVHIIWYRTRDVLENMVKILGSHNLSKFFYLGQNKFYLSWPEMLQPTNQTLVFTYLLFLFILEFERRLNRTSFVKESSPHVDFVHQTQIEANEIQRGIKYTVGNKLRQDLALLQIVLKPPESKR